MFSRRDAKRINLFHQYRNRITAGSGDTAVTTEYYYDEKGILRFIYNEFGAVNGTAGAYRIYFDETGKQIYMKHAAQGPFGSSVEPPEEIKNPKEHFERIGKQ